MRVIAPLALMLASGFSIAEPLSLEQIMKFQTLKNPALADNGQGLAYVAQPDWGEATGYVTNLNKKVWTVEQGTKPSISADGAYALFEVKAPLWERQNAGKKKAGKMSVGRTLINSDTGEQRSFDKVTSSDFSASGRFLMVQFEAEEADDTKDKDDTAEQPEAAEEQGAKIDIAESKLGTKALLIDLSSGKELELTGVTQFSFAKDADILVWATSFEEGVGNQVVRRDLAAGTDTVLWQGQDLGATAIAQTEDGQLTSFSTTLLRSEDKFQLAHKLWLADGAKPANELSLPDDGMLLTEHSKLHFSRDNQRLFVGRQLPLPQELTIEEFSDSNSLYDMDTLMSRVELNVWHGDDPRIKTNEINQYKKARKHNYVGVMHLKDKRFVQLADASVPDVTVADNQGYLLASSDQPYLKMISWAGFYKDWYLVDLNTGERRLLVTQQGGYQSPTLSPTDSGVAWFVRGDLYRHNIANNQTEVVSHGEETGFADEDHDYPSPAPGYGFGSWLGNGRAVVAYDKFDLWQLDIDSGKLTALTAGREHGWQYREIDLDADSDLHPMGEPMLLHGYNVQDKREGAYQLGLSDRSWKVAQQGDYKLSFVAKAEDSDTLLFSKQRYDLYPDLLTTDATVSQLTKVTELGNQLDGLDWGQAELVHWRSNDGKPLSGVVITPHGYKGDKPLPTLVYFYRFMSQRLHNFPQMALNHRPNFAQYVNDGYAVFLPDIRFEVGHPGQSSLSSMLPGVQKIIDMGIAKADAIGVQGHSWAGYQDAYLITQTDIFAAAVSGAPVSNMTSAYGGIRWGSGLTRQFQYESGQSRIGKSLMEAPHLYIENSPVFHVDRIDTPLVIMFGDEDEAVPYEQGLELYMAMRRAAKPVVMLQYEGEPHHLKKYPNKVDYSIKMKAFFDHHLKGAPAPTWWTQGVPYLKANKAD
ncbi:S9 family peptidase [Ferrimonas aestuarii]|uniref:S9 family peptidase n=1 Tax=Ferrimonas aestuarii TaxID=2569539 RepID=A0A4U1BST7_9GAMM|nr:prolyl oligopeptidase family serine peptidase [Ferrimonas aestuarii]TKB56677.1 S9 family peptidase [Ferrimonas aestuarii]